MLSFSCIATAGCEQAEAQPENEQARGLALQAAHVAPVGSVGLHIDVQVFGLRPKWDQATARRPENEAQTNLLADRRRKPGLFPGNGQYRLIGLNSVDVKNNRNVV
jgi:hypothetical protein